MNESIVAIGNRREHGRIRVYDILTSVRFCSYEFTYHRTIFIQDSYYDVLEGLFIHSKFQNLRAITIKTIAQSFQKKNSA